MSVILNPVEQYFDVDGSPLQSGYLYFGEVYGNPVTQPVMVYFDPEFTIPAAQPVRTINGYPVRSGTATGIYAPDDVSILVQNQNKEQVIYIQSSAIDTGDTTTIYRDSDTTFNADDNNKTFIMLSPFTQTFDAASTLGDRWRVNIINMSGGDVILNPNLSETIDGQATLTLTANQTITVYCDGVNLFTNLVNIKIVPDDPYSASGWDGNFQVPTKNAIRDKIEAILNAILNSTNDPTFSSTSSTDSTSPQWVNGLIAKLFTAPSKKYVDFTASRSSGITYTNSTGRAFDISVIAGSNPGGGSISLTVDGVIISQYTNGSAVTNAGTVYASIPDGSTYIVNATSWTISRWMETR